MFSGIFGKKSDHPMADMKSAQAILDDLPKNDTHKSLMELTEWIESVVQRSDFKLDHQFAVLRLLDETAQPYVRKLVREYFVPHELNKFQENRLWLMLGNFFRHSTHAYFTVFERYCNEDKGAGAIKAQLPLLVARTVRATTGQLKYVCAHYGPVEPVIWNSLARLYLHAEQQQYLGVPLELYAGAAGRSAVQSEFAHLLAWYGCGVGTLEPLCMHLTERILAHYRAGLAIGVQQHPDSLFSFDLNHPAAPLRVNVEARAQPSVRFVGMTALQPQLEGLIGKLGKGGVPEELSLGGSYDAEAVRQAARHLLGFLTAPPSRRSVRRGIKVRMNVVSGFARVVERTEIGLNFSDEQPAYWEIEDISASGFRTVLPAQGADGIRIGSLLGVQPDGVTSWGVAVVRRLLRDEASQLHVGAQMLSNQISGVAVSQSGGGGGGFEDGQPALWLNAKQDGLTGETMLMLKADSFSPHRSLLTQLHGKGYLLIPNRLQEKGADYDLASFRIIEQEARDGGA